MLGQRRRRWTSIHPESAVLCLYKLWRPTSFSAGGPRVVVSTAAFHARVRGSRSRRFERNKMFLPHPLLKLSIVGSLRNREVACSTSDLQCLNFESCVWRAVSSHSSHHPQEVLLAQYSLYVHKNGLKPDLFHFQRVFQFEFIINVLVYLNTYVMVINKYFTVLYSDV